MCNRGFPRSEFENRMKWIQEEMCKENVDVIVLTSPNEIYYYTGLETQFFQSPSRPYYLVLSQHSSKPVAVFPEIMGMPILETTWIETCHTWISPNRVDDGVSLLLRTIQDLTKPSSNIGFVLGSETKLHPCQNDINKIFKSISISNNIVDVTSLIQKQRSIKSNLEIDKIAHICDVVSNSLHDLPDLIHAEVTKNPSIASSFTERDVCRVLRSDIMGQRHGADSIPYMMAQSGQGGYSNIVLGPTDRVLKEGDVLIVDTGSRFDGYFSDFDRNYVIGEVPDDTLRAHEALWCVGLFLSLSLSLSTFTPSSHEHIIPYLE